MERIGYHRIEEGIQSETSYKQRAFELGLKAAIIKLSTAEECANWEYVEGRYPTTDCHSTVRHIGEGRHVDLNQAEIAS